VSMFGGLTSEGILEEYPWGSDCARSGPSGTS